MTNARFPAQRTRFAVAAVVLGAGLGGFFDGIVFHQLLQWHHIVSARVAPDTLDNLRLNTLGDGIFHAATWLLTVTGVFLLVGSRGAREVQRSSRALAGGMLVGWGSFNLIEGTVDHHLLGLHHVRPGPDELLYDTAFLAWGLGMLIAGVPLLRSANGTALVDAGATSAIGPGVTAGERHSGTRGKD